MVERKGRQREREREKIDDKKRIREKRKQKKKKQERWVIKKDKISAAVDEKTRLAPGNERSQWFDGGEKCVVR